MKSSTGWISEESPATRGLLHHWQKIKLRSSLPTVNHFIKASYGLYILKL